VGKLYSEQGITASANLATIYQREIFFQVDPASLDYLPDDHLYDKFPSGFYLDLDVKSLLGYLPDLEAEIFFLVYVKKKNQKDVGRLLNLSQPTVSYRFRRVFYKMSYLLTLLTIDVRAIIDDLGFLKDYEKDVLFDLFFYTNQERVGKKHGVRQSSVKWIFVKTKRRLTELERADCERWFNHLGLFILLEKNMGMRIMR